MTESIIGAASLGPAGFVAGAGIKLITGILGNWITANLELRRQEKLLLLDADTERIKVLQGGEDKPDPMTRVTRRILALGIIGTYCFVWAYIAVTGNDILIKYPVEKQISFVWEVLSPFGVINKGILEVSLLGILSYGILTIVPFIAGFYFTKIGK